ncbi:MAG TPA: class I SAM-dependent methyltransferase [Rhodothermales bacterium]|nr:class I SAM-dependent methyltransferase [Rhodothermales bacterium]
MVQPPKLYTDLANWWHLLSCVEDYAEEAAIYAQALTTHARRSIDTVLELGAGGGNNAFHLKASFEMTLVDLSEAMLAQSRIINPDCEHHAGDMRTVRLGRTFDAVFIHDALAYLTTTDDLRRTMETAFVHCHSGGVALFAPDHIQETFQPSTNHGGYDGPDRGIRYLEWTWDPDPTDTTHLTDYAYLLRLPDGSMRVEHDRHVNGLFSRQTWLEAITSVGFEAQVLPFEHSEVEPGTMELFLGLKP